MMPWQVLLITAFAVIEILIVWAHRWTQQNSPEYSLWVVMGAKVLKLVLSIGSILLVNFLTEIPVITFSLWLMGCYIVTIVVESAFFIKKK
jgi:hypothetical protein